MPWKRPSFFYYLNTPNKSFEGRAWVWGKGYTVSILWKQNQCHSNTLNKGFEGKGFVRQGRGGVSCTFFAETANLYCYLYWFIYIYIYLIYTQLRFCRFDLCVTRAGGGGGRYPEPKVVHRKKALFSVFS